ncbi:hypothetical protein [Agromyces sp. LHK192]|uniref:hypothetical protein n=1 Tax=Agromyces sp. LHK192 TaxID=2498704 RepID=UPI000FD8665A|nr:hypothetical protein [Agromyces sp. LHK192]
MRALLPTLTRSWPMLAALGAGLVLVAVGAGALDGAIRGIATSVTLAGCGLTALGWGVLALRAGAIPAPTATLGAVVGVLLLTAVLLSNGLAAELDLAALPLLAADALLLVVGIGAALALRRGQRGSVGRGRQHGRPSEPVGTSLVGMAVGAALVAALATPALAGTEAGGSAVPHGELHGIPDGVGGHAH